MKKIMGIVFVVSGLFAGSLDKDIAKVECDQMIDKQVIDICYNYKAKGANYVKYTLYADKVNAVNIKKRPRFYTEKTLPAQYRVKYSDYTHIIGTKDCNYHKNEACMKKMSYDRGHLAPDADFDYDKKVLRKVYTMANIIPQVSIVNQKTWTKVERYERLLATKLGKINVVTGVFYGDMDNFYTKKPLEYINTSKWKRNTFKKYEKQKNAIEKKKAVIPVGYWKYYYNDEKGTETCFYYENKLVDHKKDKLSAHKIECSKLKGFL
jgi:endonuclease G